MHIRAGDAEGDAHRLLPHSYYFNVTRTITKVRVVYHVRDKGSISCAALWLVVKPHAGLVGIVCDTIRVCLAAVHGVNVGRCMVWAIYHPEKWHPALAEPAGPQGGLPFNG